MSADKLTSNQKSMVIFLQIPQYLATISLITAYMKK